MNSAWKKLVGLYLLAMFVAGCSGAAVTTPASDAEVSVAPRSAFPPVRLMGEDTPYFWLQAIKDDKGNLLLQENAFYRDKRYAEFSFRQLGTLERVAFYDSRETPRVLFYEAEYDASGRRISKCKSYRNDGSLDTTFQRLENGEEKTQFYSPKKTLLKEVLTRKNGSQHTTEYADDGVKIASEHELSPELREQVVLTQLVEEEKVPRIKLRLAGARILDWQYFNKEGKLDHKAEFQEDGSIRFVYFNAEGVNHRTQVWELTGEDWSGAFYHLAMAEIYDLKTRQVDHRALFHENGYVKQHRRFSKKGEVEAIRDFDKAHHEVRMEEFDEAQKSKQVWEFKDQRRGFIPLGLYGEPGAEDPERPAYRFEGVPFAKPYVPGQLNPLFILDGQ